jgi:hypothetical protein
MTRISSIILAVLLSAIIARDAVAQWNVARFEASQRTAYTTVGLDPAIVASLGYASVFSVGGRAMQVSTEVGVPVASLDANDFRVRLGIQSSLVRRGSVQLTGSITASTRGTENTIYRGINFGADFAGTLGVYRPGWFTAGEIGYDAAVITHVTHSEYYRKNFYADAKDGWYLDAGGTYRFGAAGGVTLGRAELVGRSGWLRSEYGNDVLPPFYGTLGVGFKF